MATKVTKAVFPVAGLGTRFLPATKSCPKEMLPIVDKPLIQYAVEEACNAGIKEIIFVTSHGKRAIEDHFDSNPELEAKLLEQQKDELYDLLTGITPKDVSFVYVRQPRACGLGHAVSMAKNLISKDEYFAVLLADDLIWSSSQSCLKQMVLEYNKINSSIVAVEEINIKDSNKYGIVGINKEISNNLSILDSIIEKPIPKDSPSNLAVVGRYLLSGKIFECLSKVEPDKHNEIQLTDAISMLLNDNVYAYKFDGKRYDCGSKLGYLKATVDYALRHPTLGKNFRFYLDNVSNKMLESTEC